VTPPWDGEFQSRHQWTWSHRQTPIQREEEEEEEEEEGKREVRKSIEKIEKTTKK